MVVEFLRRKHRGIVESDQIGERMKESKVKTGCRKIEVVETNEKRLIESEKFVGKRRKVQGG